MDNGFKSGDEVFCSYKNDDGNIKSGWFSLVEISSTAVILRTRENSVLFFPIDKILKMKKRGFHD